MSESTPTRYRLTPPGNPFAVWAVVCGVVGFCVPAIGGLAAIVLGVLGVVRANKTPFKKEVRVELLAHEIDEAVIQAHHLQVGKVDFLRLAEARFDAFQHQRDRAQG